MSSWSGNTSWLLAIQSAIITIPTTRLATDAGKECLDSSSKASSSRPESCPANSSSSSWTLSHSPETANPYGSSQAVRAFRHSSDMGKRPWCAPMTLAYERATSLSQPLDARYLSRITMPAMGCPGTPLDEGREGKRRPAFLALYERSPASTLPKAQMGWA